MAATKREGLAMKKSDIRVGKTYNNGKGDRFCKKRKVFDEGVKLIPPGQDDQDCVKCQKTKTKTVRAVRWTGFAAWAKGEVE